MTTPHPAPAEKLTAEEERIWLDPACDHTIDAHGERCWAGMEDPWDGGCGECGAPSVEYVRADLLDASRAETEAVRRERDEAVASATAWHKAYCDTARSLDALRSLAAELVEGLADMVARYGDFAPGKPFLFPPDHHINLARDLLSRARAQGIGGEREKGNG